MMITEGTRTIDLDYTYCQDKEGYTGFLTKHPGIVACGDTIQKVEETLKQIVEGILSSRLGKNL